MKTIQANCATSKKIARLDITFDESTGIITGVSEAKKGRTEAVSYTHLTLPTKA